tara:strand:+ start:402 stop:572 length:171 start_codon:yes stop_codon:yes gene_type:complete
MILIQTQELPEMIIGVEIVSATGSLILTIGILFTVGVPLIMILKGNKLKLLISISK